MGAVATVVPVALLAVSCSTDPQDAVEDVSEQVDDAADQADQAVADIAESLREEGLESLASAIREVAFTELTTSDEFTFFAPGDEAFRSLEAEQIAELLADPDRLDDVLRRHLVDETLTVDELGELTSVETVDGTLLEVSADGGSVTVGGATIGDVDVEVSGGVVHTVDRIFIDA